MVGSGPPLLMFSPGGFGATMDNWRTQGIYRRLRLLDHLARSYTCVIFDRRESGQSGGRVERLTWGRTRPRAGRCSTTSGSTAPF